MENINLDMRLGSAAELVPNEATLLDVGTDHGYLPAKLILDGKISVAGAADINEDPLAKAVATAEKYGVKDKMAFYLSDGLRGIGDIDRYDCISICGMGGELIARILSDSPRVKEDGVTLVLQPMSSVEELSEYLASAGFGITDERIAFAAGKLYRVISAAYDGTVRTLTHAEHLIGKINISRGAKVPYFSELLLKNILKYKRICDGKRAGNIDCTEDAAVLAELCAIARKEGVDYDNT